MGTGAETGYDVVRQQVSIYIVGYGPLPPHIGVGYFFTASHLDYSTLCTALQPY
jgi:hypothetical protein